MLSRKRNRGGLALALAFALALPPTPPVLAGELPRAPLERMWEDHMLAGTFVKYLDGELRPRPADLDPFESAKGDVGKVASTKHGIVVQDLRETRWVGLRRQGGWTIEGGLLAEVQEKASKIELYGKLIRRHEAHTVLNLHPDNTWKHSYEFFLLHRRKDAPGADVIRKWVLTRQQLLSSRGSELLRGSLDHDKASATATVTITDIWGKLHHTEAVGVGEILRQGK